MDSQRLLDRFLRYVAIDTTADESAETYPSSAGQRKLGALLADELRLAGLHDVCHDEHGLILASVPATADHDIPVVAFNAHLDTSPETGGAGVRPQVLRGYQGGDLVLPGDPSQVIRVAEHPELAQLQGCTLITSDGTTLLGADDKAGVAIVMETVHHLLEHPEIAHGPLRILFTCDEEIGRGVDHVDLARLGAHVCYTLDGAGANNVDVETFSADLAIVTVRGVNIHPSIAKGKMVNAVRAAGAFLDRLPRGTLAPESSEGRDGFLHPYTIKGGVAEVVIRILLRNFETSNLDGHAERLRDAAAAVQQTIPGADFQIAVRPQYRNLAEGLRREPRAVQYIQEAHARLGRTARLTVIRGGTDGALLTARGLPTPNLSSGQHAPHSTLEWACLEEMRQGADTLVELVRVWAEKSGS